MTEGTGPGKGGALLNLTALSCFFCPLQAGLPLLLL